MKKKNKKYIYLFLSVISIGGATLFFIVNQPHRNIQAAPIDYTLTTTELVNEYLTHLNASNKKYLNTEGNSKILAIKGIVSQISTNLNNQHVVLLQNKNDKAGVRCTFLPEANTSSLKKGDLVTVKGVIISGAQYDNDLELYEDVILAKCNLLLN